MKKVLIVFLVTALLCIISSLSNAESPPRANIFVESKEAESGSSFFIKINLSGNYDPIASLRIPLKFDDQYLSCTYVDFSGSVLNPEMISYYEIKQGGIEIAYIPPVVNPLPVFSADSGLLATVYFTLSPDAPSGDIVIDSVCHNDQFEQLGATIDRWTRIEMADNSGTAVNLPTFEGGLVTVLRPTDISDHDKLSIPSEFALFQNYPNPFNPSTKISFALPENSVVRIEIFNLLGQSVAVLADGEFAAGSHNIEWNAADKPSGLYFYKLTANSQSLTRKMTLIK